MAFNGLSYAVFQSYAAPTGYLIPVPTSKTSAASSDNENITTQTSVIYIHITVAETVEVFMTQDIKTN
jgi:hypothetical protein